MSQYVYYQGAPKPLGINGKDLILLLWPIHVAKVYVQDLPKQELNIFEETILELISSSTSGVTNPELIAQWLGVESELVRYILDSKFTPNGWITRDNSISDEGRKVLENSGAKSQTTARLMRCAITGDWLPRIAFDIGQISGEEANKKTKFKLSRGSDYYDKGTRLKPLVTQSSAPTSEELRSIANRFEKALRIAKATRDEFCTDSWGVDYRAMKLEDSLHELAYLMVWVEKTPSFDWIPHDPFNISERSEWMKDLFDEACRKDSYLVREFTNRFERDVDGASFADVKKQIQETARLELLADYPNLSVDNVIYDSLLEFQCLLESARIEDYESTHAFRALIVSAGAALEFVCGYVLDNYPVQNVHLLPSHRTRDDQKRSDYERRFKSLGLSAAQVERVMSVRTNNIRGAAERRNTSCRALLAAGLLSTESHADHPYHKLMKDKLLFEAVYDLSHIRDEAAHAARDQRGRSIKFTNRKAEKASSTLRKFLKLVV